VLLPFQPEPAFNGRRGAENFLFQIEQGAVQGGDKMGNHNCLKPYDKTKDMLPILTGIRVARALRVFASEYFRRHFNCGNCKES
jgi:hypothetical protein